MIEHVAHPERILAEIRRVLRPRGLLLLSTPNGGRLRTGLPTFSQIKDRTPFEARQFQPDSDGHLFLYRRDELGPLLRTEGFWPEQHRFYGTPWVTGRLGFRHWMSWLHPPLRRRLDQWTLRIPLLAARLAEGQVALAVRNDS
jgi:2-polyprenyl-6-hydroxyphenyl methylase/3-demethylubiquinone-9 3-methyltransferase